MRLKKGFTLIELLVVIAIIAMLLSILMPSLRKAKLVARGVICRSNMKQWGLLWSMYLGDSDSKFPWGNEGVGDHTLENGQWFNALEDYYKFDNTRYCPTATKYDAVRTFKAWEKPATGNWDGSYAINEWIHKPEKSSSIATGKFWGTSLVSNSSMIPLMSEGTWWKIKKPEPDNPRPPERDFDLTVYNAIPYRGLARACVDRHNKSCNVLYLDLSVRSTGLKELWSLKWHRKWVRDPAMLTDADYWPEWMNGS